MLFVAGLAAVEVGAHAWDQLVGARCVVAEFELDVAVELLEALIACQLGTGGTQQALQEIVVQGGVGAHCGASLGSVVSSVWPSVSKRRRSLRRASWMVL